MEEKIANIAFWIGLPFYRLLEHNPRKWVRVVGLLSCFLLFPLTFICLLLLMVSMAIGMFKEI